MTQKFLLGACALLISCTTATDDASSTIVRAEANDLGISQLEIVHQDQQGERILMIRGLDADNHEIASARLLVGRVHYSPDGDVSDQLFPGTELVVTAGTDTVTMSAPDREPHGISQPRLASMSTFLALDAVAAEIKYEADIWIEAPHASSGEVAFATTCPSSLFPTNKDQSASCCKETTGNTFHVIGNSGPTQGKVAERKYNANACRTSSGATGCTSNCYYGPCKGANLGTYGSCGPNGCVAPNQGRVFYPQIAFQDRCGWASPSTGEYWPEPWNNQPMYPVMFPSCPYTGCNANGTPF